MCKSFKAALVITSKSRNNPNKLPHTAWYIHTMEYYMGSENDCNAATGISMDKYQACYIE